LSKGSLIFPLLLFLSFFLSILFYFSTTSFLFFLLNLFYLYLAWMLLVIQYEQSRWYPVIRNPTKQHRFQLLPLQQEQPHCTRSWWKHYSLWLTPILALAILHWSRSVRHFNYYKNGTFSTVSNFCSSSTFCTFCLRPRQTGKQPSARHQRGAA
jgi:hypothetical protein